MNNIGVDEDLEERGGQGNALTEVGKRGTALIVELFSRLSRLKRETYLNLVDRHVSFQALSLAGQ